MKVLDEVGVELRSSHRLARKSYVSVRPNYLWYIDGYNNINWHGFAIHGAIDGLAGRFFSWEWLHLTTVQK